MKNYEVSDTPVTETSKNCINCAHCYIPSDFLLGLDQAEFYCNLDKDKPISGDVLSEPFNYYNSSILDKQEEKWREWGTQHFVCYNGTCDMFTVSK